MQDTYKYISLSAEEKANLENQLAKCVSSLMKLFNEQYSQLSSVAFRAKMFSAKTKEEIDAVFGDYTEAKEGFFWIRKNENIFWEQYVRLVLKTVTDFTRRFTLPLMDFDDYKCVAFEAFWRALYMYNGETQLSTFLTVCIRRELSNLIRDYDRSSGTDVRAKGPYAAMIGIIEEYGVDEFEAVEMLKQRTKISENKGAVLRNRYRSRAINTMSLNEVALDVGFSKDVNEYHELFFELLDSADLSPKEKQMLLDKYHGKSVVDDSINPATGRKYTRQNSSRIFMEAKSKLRRHYQKMLATT